jgi:hypothetical protein
LIAYDGWYKRIENNGWRPVSTKHLLQMNMDYYYGIESSKVVFHHSKVLELTFFRFSVLKFYDSIAPKEKGY